MMRVWAAIVLVALWLFLADFTPKSLLGLTLVPLAFFMCCCDNGQDTPCCVGHNLPPTLNLALTVTIERDESHLLTWHCQQGDFTLFHWGDTTGHTGGPGLVYINSPFLFECDSFDPNNECRIVAGGVPGVFLGGGETPDQQWAIVKIGSPVSCVPVHYVLEGTVEYQPFDPAVPETFPFGRIIRDHICSLFDLAACLAPFPGFPQPTAWKVRMRAEITE
jgi:hypothetical protein